MLALCRNSRQVVVTDEEPYSANMIGELLGKRQRVAYQAGDALSQRVVEALDVMGLAR